jgi:gliding motility-associated-like protein
LSNPSSVPTTLTFTTTIGTAGASDYTTINTTVTIPAGATSVPVLVPTTIDTISEGTETFTIAVTTISTNTISTTIAATGTILDNLSIVIIPTVSISSTTVNEGQVANFIISLNAPSAVPTTIVVTIPTGGTAGSSDYTFTTTTVVIPAGVTSVVLPIQTNQDTVVESSETFILSVTVLSTNTANNQVVVLGTILDVPPPCDIVVYAAVTPNGDGENDYFRIDGLECNSENTVMIYNRWGILVFERDGYNQSNAFRGDSEGRVNIQQGTGLPEGTYWYILKYKNQSTGNVSEKAGWLYVNR